MNYRFEHFRYFTEEMEPHHLTGANRSPFMGSPSVGEKDGRWKLTRIWPLRPLPLGCHLHVRLRHHHDHRRSRRASRLREITGLRRPLRECQFTGAGGGIVLCGGCLLLQREQGVEGQGLLERAGEGKKGMLDRFRKMN